MSDQAQQIIDYVVRDVMRRPEAKIDENTPLVSSGLIDSLALIDIVQKLEDITQTRIPAGKLQAKDLDTVQLMLNAVQRVGKPRPPRP